MNINIPTLPVPPQGSEDFIISFLKDVPAEVQARFPETSTYLHELAHAQAHIMAIRSSKIATANEFDNALKSSDLDSKEGVASLSSILCQEDSARIADNPSPAGKMPSIEGLPELVEYFCHKIVDNLKKERSGLLNSESDLLSSPKESSRSQIRSLVQMHTSLVNWNKPDKVRNFFHAVGPINQATNIIASLMNNPECRYRHQIGKGDLHGLLLDIKTQEEDNRAQISRMTSHLSTADFGRGECVPPSRPLSP